MAGSGTGVYRDEGEIVDEKYQAVTTDLEDHTMKKPITL